ncbi:MAG: aminomethyl-transferring glycine dehydrogenase subunit GcvPA [Rhizobiaceae bacterium]|nr:aminomethyl-transferring glycine dehydrogenase subunit GcvPA [Rhizobiaceae bacterium]
MTRGTAAHPWMANSVDAIKAEMLATIGAKSIGELFEQIPADHGMKAPLALPAGMRSEAALKRHLRDIAAKNSDCEANLSFLGGGIWQHHVPAVCDELVRRQEWLSSVFGSPESDHGRNQAWFEFSSQLGELLDMDLVGMPVYSWGCAAGHAIRMAARLTGRSQVVIAGPVSPERLSVIRTYCAAAIEDRAIDVVLVGSETQTGLVDLGALRSAVGASTAAVYFENPGYHGLLETRAAEISKIARTVGAETIVGVDPLTLGVIAPPSAYGADIAVGSIQPLGVHMHGGGGVGGFIASRHEEQYAREYPTFLVSIAPTSTEGEHGFGLSLFHQTSYGMRDEGKDWTGNSTYLWTIAGAAYMALLGPQGFAELGRAILSNAHRAAEQIGGIAGVKIRHPTGFFKEFMVDFTATGKSVAAINKALLAHGIFGGIDLSADDPDLGQTALYCVTEIHTDADIDTLVAALKKVLSE